MKIPGRDTEFTPLTLRELRLLVSSVDGAESDDWEETTREERHLMGVARTLALTLLAFYREEMR